MNEIERQIANIPIPSVSSDLDARIQKLLRPLEGELPQHSRFYDSVNVSLIDLFRFRHYSRRIQMLVRCFVGAVAVASIVLAAFLVTNQGTRSIAFEQVQESVKQVNTVSYLVVMTTEAGDSSTSEPNEEMGVPSVTQSEMLDRVDFLKSELSRSDLNEFERKERSAELQTIQAFLVDETQVLSVISWIRNSGRDRMRTETVLPSSAPMMSLAIFNGREGKHIARDDEQKQFYILNTSFVIDGTELPELPDSSADFFKDVLSIPVDGLTPLPEKLIDDKLAIGFSVVFNENQTTKYWVDPSTLLPVRIEYLTAASDDGPSMQTVLSAFTYDAPLEESLFDVAVPEGYEVQEFQTTLSSEATAKE